MKVLSTLSLHKVFLFSLDILFKKLLIDLFLPVSEKQNDKFLFSFFAFAKTGMSIASSIAPSTWKSLTFHLAASILYECRAELGPTAEAYPILVNPLAEKIIRFGWL